MERIENRKARHDYTILETYEAGVALSGPEVKSVRAHRASLDGAYVDVRGPRAELLNMHIEPYQPKNQPETYDSRRPRVLLLSTKELRDLAVRQKEGGLTVVPLAMYSKGRYIKLSVGLARGKKKRDKREALKKEAARRDTGRTLKNR